MKTLDDLRRFTVARNFPQPTTLKRAIQRMGFVQADPIRAPARAQDLILRQRVKDYRAGDLELRYPALDIDEDVFVNYGFVTRTLQALMHPRTELAPKPRVDAFDAEVERLVLEFVRERVEAHPREVDEHFAHGRVTNFWGGSSNATTKLLEEMHYRGLLRVTRREKGIRIYRACQRDIPDLGTDCISKSSVDAAERDKRIDALVDAVVQIYAPLPSRSLSYYVGRLRYAVPHWHDQLRSALQRARGRLSHASVDGIDWFWSGKTLERLAESTQDRVRLLAPFDPLVHDRTRFELLWGWSYRFEAYTPVALRQHGYYALPLLWRDRVIGWANVSARNDKLDAEIGYVKSGPRERAFKSALAAELERFRGFLHLTTQ